MNRYILSCVAAGALSVSAHASSYDKYLEGISIDHEQHCVFINLNSRFSSVKITEKTVRKFYKKMTHDAIKAMPNGYERYDFRIMYNGRPIETLLGQTDSMTESLDEKKSEKKKRSHSRGWWNVESTVNPWVTNVSRPHVITDGLNGRHIALWASHGRFYDSSRGKWRWQRPNMFCTNEDLFTQTIVVPYLIPMLENAGATVFTPRERDWQPQEVIVDNDSPFTGYTEHIKAWKSAEKAGFAIPAGRDINDGHNPFVMGTARMASASDDNGYAPQAEYSPSLSMPGRYAVYVSYVSLPGSADDALYTVYHKGQRTDFRVNQTMGGGTWVYLGTFDFDQSGPQYNKVVVTAHSARKGTIVTTDAVRFGGGMGNIMRGGSVSGLPRCFEGARYWAQWAGAPREVYSTYDGTDDYKDDINVRSLITNWMAGGSAYVPDKDGLRVPIDLSLAIHSDAGFNPDMRSLYGSLAICTTQAGDNVLATGISREKSKDLAEELLHQSKSDIRSKFGEWEWRDLYDRNYSETRMPAVPSAIFETLSHQSFPDMRYALDPTFRFTLARSIYKTLLRYEAKAHGTKAVVTPLQPTTFAAVIDDDGRLRLTWHAQRDTDESSADATSYNVYTAMGEMDYDNGYKTEVTSYSVRLQPDLLYRFRVTAVNSGGESFPTEELCVVWHGPNAKTVCIVNAFDRLSAPAIVNTPTEKGFDIDADPGLSYGLTAGWSGKQQVYSTSTAGREGAGTFAYSGDEMAGKFVAGNSFNYVTEHASAIMSAGQYNVVSASHKAIESGLVSLDDMAMVDVILGNQRHDPSSVMPYELMSSQLVRRLSNYAKRGGGALLVSGSYLTEPSPAVSLPDFLLSTLKVSGAGSVRESASLVNGLQNTWQVTTTLNPDHYAAVQCNVLTPQSGGFVAMQYSNGSTAAVASKGRTNTFTMGFPFECVSNTYQRSLLMRGLLAFLIK